MGGYGLYTQRRAARKGKRKNSTESDQNDTQITLIWVGVGAAERAVFDALTTVITSHYIVNPPVAVSELIVFFD